MLLCAWFRFQLVFVACGSRKQVVTLDAAGVHVMGRQLLFPRGISRLHRRDTVPEPGPRHASSDVPIAAAATQLGRLVPPTSVDINDKHVCYGHSHAGNLCGLRGS